MIRSGEGASLRMSATRKVPTPRKPSGAALLLAVIPFLALCFAVPLWDRVYPMIFGLPFNLCWLIFGIALSSLCLWLANRIEERREQREKPP
jgi:hypothetical protein